MPKLCSSPAFLRQVERHGILPSQQCMQAAWKVPASLSYRLGPSSSPEVLPAGQSPRPSSVLWPPHKTGKLRSMEKADVWDGVHLEILARQWALWG